MNKLIKYSAVFAVIFTIVNGFFGLRVFAGVPEEALNSVVRVLVVNYGGSGEIRNYSTLSAFAVGEEGKSVEYFITGADVLRESCKGNSSEIYLLLDDDAVSFNNPEENYYGEADTVKVEAGVGGIYLDINPTKAVKCDIVYSGDEEKTDIAILRTIRKIKNRRSAKLASSQMVSRGSKTYTIGFSRESEESEIETDPENCLVTTGNISKITEDKNSYSDIFEIESKEIDSIAGGPVVTEEGAVIGINTGTVLKKGKSLTRYYVLSADYIGKILSSEGVDFTGFGDEVSTKEDKGKVPVGIIIAIVIMSLAVIAVIIVAAVTAGSGKKDKSKIKQTGPYAKIVCIGGAMNGLSYIVGENPVTIGRSSDCNIVYPNETFGISRRHVRLYTLKGKLYISDLGSTAGTQIIGSGNLFPNRATEIGLYQKFCLGDITNVFEVQPAE